MRMCICPSRAGLSIQTGTRSPGDRCHPPAAVVADLPFHVNRPADPLQHRPWKHLESYRAYSSRWRTTTKQATFGRRERSMRGAAKTPPQPQSLHRDVCIEQRSIKFFDGVRGYLSYYIYILLLSQGKYIRKRKGNYAGDENVTTG